MVVLAALALLINSQIQLAVAFIVSWPRNDDLRFQYQPEYFNNLLQGRILVIANESATLPLKGYDFLRVLRLGLLEVHLFP